MLMRHDGLQNAPDKSETATIKYLNKVVSPFTELGHTPNCQIKIKWMDETDNNGAILSQQLFWIVYIRWLENWTKYKIVCMQAQS